MVSFNEDGSLKVEKKKKQDHLSILNIIYELDYGVGKKLAISILRGEINTRIRKGDLDKLIYHGSLGGYDEKEIEKLIDHLILNNYIEIEYVKQRFPVLRLTPIGEEERIERNQFINIDELDEKLKDEIKIKNPFKETIITDEDRELFNQLDFFLNKFTDEQKKAIVSNSKRILCVAGAGSGKTTVLTKRIEFIVKYKSVPPKEILAITFTRKAKEEMQNRLNKLLGFNNGVRIETFNSFCEGELIKKGYKYYKKDVSMVNNREMIDIILTKLQELNFTLEGFINIYFTQKQQIGKDRRKLFFSFLYDFYSILGKIKNNKKSTDELNDFVEKIDSKIKYQAKTVIKLIQKVMLEMQSRGLRHYADQIIDTLEMYREYSELIQSYEYVLVDEYQDVNDSQIELLKLISKNNLFVVGDPRQSIYGWRGSKIKYIIDFPKEKIGLEESETIQLTSNFRSDQKIIELFNKLIEQTGYAHLKSESKNKGEISLKYYPNEREEAENTIRTILDNTNSKRKEVFVLSRTNKQLEIIKDLCEKNNIEYVMRTDDERNANIIPNDNQITLSTVHAIKGLEAEMVFVIGVNNKNYPCKASDHPIVEAFQFDDDYNSFAEELRLLYVALSRAKKKLIVSYFNTASPFLTKDVENVFKDQTTLSKIDKKLISINNGRDSIKDSSKLISRLKNYRYQEAQDRGIPAYRIFTDVTLHQLVEIMPQSKDELLSIKGLGMAKIDEFGDDILRVLQGI